MGRGGIRRFTPQGTERAKVCFECEGTIHTSRPNSFFGCTRSYFNAEDQAYWAILTDFVLLLFGLSCSFADECRAGTLRA